MVIRILAVVAGSAPSTPTDASQRPDRAQPRGPGRTVARTPIPVPASSRRDRLHRGPWYRNRRRRSDRDARLGEALGTGAHARPLPIGSVKSNIGHLEAASGRRRLGQGAAHASNTGSVPPTIHVTTPNPNIRFAEWNIEPVTDALPLPNDRRLTIGVNSFGFGGANAHVVLQSTDAPQAADTEAGAASRYLFLSARSADACARWPGTTPNC